jgi:hypothetical protein
MSDVEITIKLPEDLVKRAQAAGVQIEAETGGFIEVLENKIERQEAANYLRDAMKKLNGSMTPEEIEEALAEARSERTAVTHQAQATGQE